MTNALALRPEYPFINQILHTDALTLLRSLPDASIDAVITDPPYPEIDRDYGRLTEAQWMELIQAVVMECKRVVKPSGSVAMILQPNYESLGKMRLWLWKFMVWCGENWNLIQDAYWWNYTAIPLAGVANGLLRPSLKYIVWLGDADCIKNQKDVLWTPSQATLAISSEDRALRYMPSGMHTRPARMKDKALSNGGSSPYNVIPIANANSVDSGGAHGHGAATPIELMEWWVKYISPKNGLVCDPFLGSGTTAIAAMKTGRRYICGDITEEYVKLARQRVMNADPHQPTTINDSTKQLSLFSGVSAESPPNQ